MRFEWLPCSHLILRVKNYCVSLMRVAANGKLKKFLTFPGQILVSQGNEAVFLSLPRPYRFSSFFKKP